MKGAVTVKQFAIDRQALSDVQETQLAQWAHVQDVLGMAPTHYQLRCAAEEILRAGGTQKKLGKNWVTNFIRRNPSLGTLQGKRLDTKRAKGVTPEKIKELFDILGGPLLRHVRPQHRYNMDETGIMEGVGVNGKHIASVRQHGAKKRRWALVKGQVNRTWVFIIECISAEGNYIPPVVIFTGKTVQAQWFPDELTDFVKWEFTSTESGYTCNDVGHEWLTKHFIPRTNPGTRDWRLLIIDGHDSHVSDEFMISCAINKVYLVYYLHIHLMLPSHLTSES